MKCLLCQMEINQYFGLFNQQIEGFFMVEFNLVIKKEK